MFDFESGGLDSLELGSRRRPVKWAVELSPADCRPQKHKARRRQLAAAQAAAEQSDKQKQHAHLQQQAQQQRLAAQRKHLEQLAQMQQQDPADVTPAQAKYRKEFRDASVMCLSTEIEQGNVEYKYRLTGCATNENRRHQLITQMKFRLSEGSGECFYYLGVEDDGYPRGLEHQELQDSIAVIHRMARSLQATARLVEYVPGGFGRTAALMHIKANAEEDMHVTDSRVAVAGSMDSGKSTLVAVLTHGTDGRPLLDNGRGSARMAVFRHKHEIESGRTSSISQQVLGYDVEGRVLNYVGVAAPMPADISAAAAHILNFIDMGGHEKYLKTTLYGMTCLLPDYALLCVDASAGVTRITREHLAVAVALEVPTALVITKADAVDEAQLTLVLQQLRDLMQPVLQSSHTQHTEDVSSQQVHDRAGGCGDTSRSGSEGAHTDAISEADLTQGSSSPAVAATSSCSSGSSRLDSAHSSSGPLERAVQSSRHAPGGVPVVTTEQQAHALAGSLSELHNCTAAPAAPSFQQAVFPVFVVSCVSGAGIPLLHAFLSHLKPLQQLNHGADQGGGGSGSNADARSSSDARGRGMTPTAAGSADMVAAACAPGAVETQQQQQQLGTLGFKPCNLDGSSQLWGVSSPPRHQQQLHRSRPGPSVTAADAPGSPPAAAAAAPAGPAGTTDAVGSTAGAVGSSRAADMQLAAAEPCGGEEGEAQAGHFQVVHTYDVEGVGWVVSGIAVTGTIEVGQTLLWGPTPGGGFSPVRVTCIQRSHVPVRAIAPGQTATLALQPLAAGLPHSDSRQALLTAAAVAQAAAAEAAAREAAAAIAAVPEPVAKTRRRSPAALKAAAAAAASTAATAAAAAAAARRAAETAGGRPWWLGVEEQTMGEGIMPAAAAADGAAGCHGWDAAAGAAGCFAVQGAGSAAAERAAADTCDSVADLLGDDFAAELAEDNSCSGSDADLFGVEEVPPSRGSGKAGSSAGAGPLGGHAAAAAAAAAAVPGNEDVFPGLAGVLGDDDAQEEFPGSSSSSSGGSSGVAPSWSFSSMSSSGTAACAGGGSQNRSELSSRLQGAAGVRERAGVGAAGAGSSQGAADVCAAGGERQLLGCSPVRSRGPKGGVLLDAAAAPHTHWEFDALLVLLGGHWPPRGLLSGCWPPAEEPRGLDGGEPVHARASAGSAAPGLSAHGAAVVREAAAGQEGVFGVAAAAGPCATHGRVCRGVQQQREAGPRQQQQRHQFRRQRRRSGRGNGFAYVIHCNSIRQIAHIVSLREVRSSTAAADDDSDEDVCSSAGSSSSGSATAAPVTTPQPAGSSTAATAVQQQQEQQEQQQARDVQHEGLTASIRAAAALLQGSSATTTDRDRVSGDSSSSGDSGTKPRLREGSSSSRGCGRGAVWSADAGSVVAARFRFGHRPEWMQVGARLIVRDRSDGHVAAAGFVLGLGAAHKMEQQQESVD